MPTVLRLYGLPLTGGASSTAFDRKFHETFDDMIGIAQSSVGGMSVSFGWDVLTPSDFSPPQNLVQTHEIFQCLGAPEC